MTEATIVEWLVEDRAQVGLGDPVLLIETDKSTLEVEAPAAGRLHRTVVVETTVAPGTVVGSVSSS